MLMYGGGSTGSLKVNPFEGALKLERLHMVVNKKLVDTRTGKGGGVCCDYTVLHNYNIIQVPI